MQEFVRKIVQVIFDLFLGKHQSDDRVVNKIIGLYQDGGFTGIFAKIRFWDAPYIEMEKMIAKRGNIVDLGCGDGIFANFLTLKSKNPTNEIISEYQLLFLDDGTLYAQDRKKNDKGYFERIGKEKIFSFIYSNNTPFISENQQNWESIHVTLLTNKNQLDKIIVFINCKFFCHYYQLFFEPG